MDRGDWLQLATHYYNSAGPFVGTFQMQPLQMGEVDVAAAAAGRPVRLPILYRWAPAQGCVHIDCREYGSHREHFGYDSRWFTFQRDAGQWTVSSIGEYMSSADALWFEEIE